MQNDHNKITKRQKRTHMNSAELKRLRQEMSFDPRHMCTLLALPRRTYQDYEAGKRGIPAELATRIRELHRLDREFINGIAARVDAAERGEL